ncbi:MAG: hypothetical protein RLZZ86_337 [Cyanobacteriota bacterium]|jgi:hypothetical protein
MDQLTLHSIGTGDKMMFFRTTDCYSTIATKTGVTKVTDPEGDEIAIPIKELLRTGTLIRLAISYQVSGTTKRKSATILAVRDKIGPILSDAEAGQIQGSNYVIGTVTKGVIKRVYMKRDASFY